MADGQMTGVQRAHEFLTSQLPAAVAA
jgi:hypothetical protein